jgi:hypothetical protein
MRDKNSAASEKKKEEEKKSSKEVSGTAHLKKRGDQRQKQCSI